MEEKSKFVEAAEAEPPLFLDAPDEIKEEPAEIKDEPIDDFADFKHEEPVAGVVCDTSNEIKEESVEIKDEPIDNFADIKHEKPIADLYCPSNGSSRSLNQTKVDIRCNGVEKEIAKWPKRPRLVDNPSTNHFRARIPVYVKCDFCEAPVPPIRYSPLNPSMAIHYFKNFIQLTPGHREKFDRIITQCFSRAKICTKHFKRFPLGAITCDLCGVQTSSFVCAPINEYAQSFFSRLISLTVEQRVQSQYFITNNLEARVCTSHVPPVYCPSSRSSRPLNQANTVAHINYNAYIRKVPKGALVNEDSCMRALSYFDQYDKMGKAFTRKKKDARVCELCGDLSSFYSFSPIDDQARTFFDKLTFTPHQRGLLENLITNNISVIICMKHFRVLEKGNMPSRLCNVCGRSTSSYVISTLNGPHGHDNFIELTSEQREAVEFLAKNNYRATICKSHFGDPQVTTTTLKSPLPKRAKVVEIEKKSVVSRPKVNNDRFRAEKNPIDEASNLDD